MQKSFDEMMKFDGVRSIWNKNMNKLRSLAQNNRLVNISVTIGDSTFEEIVPNPDVVRILKDSIRMGLGQEGIARAINTIDEEFGSDARDLMELSRRAVDI